MNIKIEIRYVYIITMPRSTVELEGFGNQGAPCHLLQKLITIELLAHNISCEKSHKAKFENLDTNFIASSYCFYCILLS